MKRIIVYILLIIAFTSLGAVGLLNQPEDTVDKSILNNIYYKYNNVTGNYETVEIKEKEIIYTGTILDTKDCSNYTFNKDTNIIKLSCGRAISIAGFTEDLLVLTINNQNEYYYKNNEDSFNKEFQNYFKTTIDAYTQSGLTLLKEKEITFDELIEKITQETESYIYITSEKCTKKCIIANNIIDKLTTSKEIYYIELNNLTSQNLSKIKEITNKELTKETLDKEFPEILLVGNNNIKNIIDLNIIGFNTDEYTNYLDDFEVNNE